MKRKTQRMIFVGAGLAILFFFLFKGIFNP